MWARWFAPALEGALLDHARSFVGFGSAFLDRAREVTWDLDTHRIIDNDSDSFHTIQESIA